MKRALVLALLLGMLAFGAVYAGNDQGNGAPGAVAAGAAPAPVS